MSMYISWVPKSFKNGGFFFPYLLIYLFFWDVLSVHIPCSCIPLAWSFSRVTAGVDDWRCVGSSVLSSLLFLCCRRKPQKTGRSVRLLEMWGSFPFFICGKLPRLRLGYISLPKECQRIKCSCHCLTFSRNVDTAHGAEKVINFRVQCVTARLRVWELVGLRRLCRDYCLLSHLVPRPASFLPWFQFPCT